MSSPPRPSTRRRSRRPGLVLGCVGVLGALPLLTLWIGGHSLAQRTAGKDAVSIKGLATPVLSSRRAAQNIVDEISRDALANDLSSVAEKIPAKACLQVKRGSNTIFEKRPDLQLIPGSNQKIVTAAAAATLLPPDTVFTTRVFGKVSASKITGNIILVGGGDPLLTTSDYAAKEKFPTLKRTSLEALAQRVFDAGVRIVTGSVVGNDDALSQNRYVTSWGSGVRGVEGGPLGALMVNDGVVVANPIKPDNPSLAAATEFTRVLRNLGISITGEPSGSGKAIEGNTEIAKIDSAPLIDVIAEMLTNSDNNTAEILMRHIGFAHNGKGTTESGLEATSALLKSWGYTNYILKDGSGLSRDNRLTCSLLASLLSRTDLSSIFEHGLATAGTTGTLSDTFSTSPVAGKLRAKTGTLMNVKSLSGFLPQKKGSSLYFAFLLNGAGIADQGNYRPLWDALGLSLSKYPARSLTAAFGVLP
ncbi:MAG: D-alanyl-D-alanine carboxypeptidase/D-alanyl-D-alanine-endopeptidase [Actinomycetes bacterium]